MLDDTKVRDLARLYACMTPDEIAAHEDWVRRYKAEQAEAGTKWAAAEEQRRATLKAADDVGAIQTILHACVDGEGMTDPYRALDMLRDAGYRRITDAIMEVGIDALEHAAAMNDVKEAHILADKILCSQLKYAGMQAVADAFKRFGKKYA